MDRIPVFRPLLESEELTAVTDAIEMGWLGMGSYVGKFEEAVGRVAGATNRQVVAVSTGHAALHLSLLVAGIGPGDEVITPSLNNIADLQAILATGAEPVFCDIDPDTLCIDPGSAEEVLGPRTRCIIATDYFCHLADYDRIEAVAKPQAIRIVHDAAHSLGSRYRGRPVGSYGDLTVFSFDPVKTITCIDGGAVILDDSLDASVLREMRLIGMGQRTDVMYRNQRAWTYDVVRLGYRYHLANPHAALGLSQIEKLGTITSSRQQSCQQYSARLAHANHVVTPPTDFADVTPFLYYVRIPAENRDQFRQFLDERGIDTGIHWQPGHKFTLFARYRRGDLRVTEKAGQEIVSLPLHSRMAPDTVDRICDVVLEFDKNLG